MTQETELPPLPESRLWYDPETQRCSSLVPLRPTYISLWDEADLRAYADARVAAAVLAERERCAPNMRRLTGLWRFGREVLPVANISFEAFLFQLDGFIDEKTRAHPLTPPAREEGMMDDLAQRVDKAKSIVAMDAEPDAIGQASRILLAEVERLRAELEAEKNEVFRVQREYSALHHKWAELLVKLNNR